VWNISYSYVLYCSQYNFCVTLSILRFPVQLYYDIAYNTSSRFHSSFLEFYEFDHKRQKQLTSLRFGATRFYTTTTSKKLHVTPSFRFRKAFATRAKWTERIHPKRGQDAIHCTTIIRRLNANATSYNAKSLKSWPNSLLPRGVMKLPQV